MTTVILIAAAFLGGALNSLAGGGTLVTFPTLLLAGLDPNDGGIRKKLAAGMKKKEEHRVYLPRVLGSGQVMMPADLRRLHKYMLEIEHISVISDEVRAIVEEEWPELVHKLPPKTPRG